MKELWAACRRGTKVSWRFGILPIQIVLAIFSMVSLVTAPWTLTIDSLFWKVFVQALASCILFITLLSVGLMPYFGQREITKDVENTVNRYQKYLDEERAKNQNLETRVRELEKS